jgi:hypothetical protein
MNVLIAERDEEIQMYKQREVALQEMYQQEKAVLQQKDAENTELRRILALQGIDVNLLNLSNFNKT